MLGNVTAPEQTENQLADVVIKKNGLVLRGKNVVVCLVPYLCRI